MAKINGVYQDKKTKKWYFYASLGFDAATGKRIQKMKRGFNTQRDAYEARIELLKDAQDIGILSNTDMNYKTFIDEIFLPDYKAKVEITTYENRQSVLQKIKNYFGKKKPADISAMEIQRFKNNLTKNYSQAYARAVYGMFSQTIEMAKNLGMLKHNLVKRVGTIPKAKVRVEFWSREEFEKVLTTFDLGDYYDHYSFVIVWLYFMTGLRVNEGTALLWDRDVDLENKTISVQYSLRLKNKDSWEFGPTKTKAGRRTIALDNDTIEILKNWKAKQEEFGKIDFVLSYNGNPTWKSTINRIVKRHAKLASVKEIQPKGLRHSHASLLINEQNANPLIVKERLGHEDIKTTLGIYGHLYTNTNFEVANKLTGLIKINTSSERKTKFQGNQSFQYNHSKNTKDTQ
ncbi:site-specific integrase [Sporolactobacillus shoreae]|uniref:Site-specific integrase n=1 Tax=Sporolactobacillus shoreae TaxID=1465501 RepID=A0A4Z0GJQ5_9BACL|nr:tyrosine-type recombinase/integrase [Sporolactobacillus shoreae]TGA96245.1 site-specific integrase [Sporolactobacillus shoreae]